MRHALLAVALASGTIACASTQTGHASRGSASYANDVVTFEELAGTAGTAANLFQALERVRPTFVRPRTYGFNPRGGASLIDVFVNGGYAGDANVLLTLHPANVATVRMERRSQAFVRHGMWLRGENVLYVTLRR